MAALWFLAIAALLSSLLLTPLTRAISLRAGLVDRPDGDRKTHASPIPRFGGVPIALSIVAAFALFGLSSTGNGAGYGVASRWPLLWPLLWKLFPACGVIVVTGLIDDLIGLRPAYKLAGQLTASAIAWSAGVSINSIGGIDLAPWLCLPLTLIWLVGCANAFNLIDGVDGLAAGIGLFATLATLVMSLLHGNMSLALATAPLAGALLGFLRYNFNPASIFLGDSGSLLLGFLLGCYGVLWSQKSATVVAMVAPMMVLSIPLLDVVLSIGRRFLRGRPIFSADRGHIHHRLLDRGLTPKAVALLLYGVCGLAAAFALVNSLIARDYAPIVLALFCLFTGAGVAKLGYIEFSVARRVLWGGALRRLLSHEIELQQMRERIRSAPTPNDCWEVIRDSAFIFGLTHVRLSLNGEVYEHRFHSGEMEPSCTLRIPIDSSGAIDCAKPLHSEDSAVGLAPFATAVSQELEAQVPRLRGSTTTDPDLAALASHVNACAQQSAAQ
jgi:UDP-GlcNAc:undecaprenyl-phosphate/decaprenyl-phosphate GlcNAc-1-phosphate transferase